jgi:iron(III) transport system substrate-binding protein
MRKWLLLGAFGLTLALTPIVEAATLPSATQKVLAQLNIDPSVMSGLDAELDVPKAWLDGARKEGSVIVFGTWRDDEFRKMTAPFNQRYPSVKLMYNRAGNAARGTKVVLALHEGRVIADVITSVADAYSEFMKIKALADLRELPGIKALADNYVADDGSWASYKLSFRCMGYNTDLVKKDDLPRTWDDLVANPRWGKGKVALSDNPNAWLLALWAAKGEQWGKDFTRRLFVDLEPQQRKEGMMALTALTVAGEFHASIPAPERRAESYAEKGAPIGYHCPEPVPITLSQIVMLEKAPHKNGGRLFINWLLSAEGQLLQYATSASVPVHKALQDPRFIPFAETIVGKPSVARGEDMLGSALGNTMLQTWHSYWMKSAEDKGKRKNEQ